MLVYQRVSTGITIHKSTEKITEDMARAMCWRCWLIWTRHLDEVPILVCRNHEARKMGCSTINGHARGTDWLEVPTILSGLCFWAMFLREYPHNSYGPKYGTKVSIYLHWIGSWRSPIDTMPILSKGVFQSWRCPWPKIRSIPQVTASSTHQENIKNHQKTNHKKRQTQKSRTPKKHP